MIKEFQKTGFVVIVFIALLLIFFWQAERAEGTPYMVKDIFPGGSSDPYELVNVDGTLFFAAWNILGRELWKSDGTAAGTVMVKDIYPGEYCSNGLCSL